jgi:hypothetical protein
VREYGLIFPTPTFPKEICGKIPEVADVPHCRNHWTFLLVPPVITFWRCANMCRYIWGNTGKTQKKTYKIQKFGVDNSWRGTDISVLLNLY